MFTAVQGKCAISEFSKVSFVEITAMVLPWLEGFADFPSFHQEMECSYLVQTFRARYTMGVKLKHDSRAHKNSEFECLALQRCFRIKVTTIFIHQEMECSKYERIILNT